MLNPKKSIKLRPWKINANSNHSYNWIHGIINISQVEIRLINIDQAKEVLARIPIARVKLSETYF